MMLTSITSYSLDSLLLELNGMLNRCEIKREDLVTIVPTNNDFHSPYGYKAVYWAPILEDIIKKLKESEESQDLKSQEDSVVDADNVALSS